MIIQYEWRTKKKLRYETENRRWRGWFLFRIIPLFIKTVYFSVEV